MLHERDPEVLLVVQAANVAALEMLEEQNKRAGQWVIKALGDAWGSG